MGETGRIRTFLAVEFDQDLKRQIARAQEELKRRIEPDNFPTIRLSWVQPHLVHLTIKFLGDVDASLVESMSHALGDVLRHHQPLVIPLGRLGVFPHAREPRVLWIGPPREWEEGEDAARLASLHQAVDGCCATFGCKPEERVFAPHLTLARIKEGALRFGSLLAQSGVLDRSLSMGAVPVRSIALIKSELRPSGPIYTRLYEVRVGNVTEL
ncbi:MAG: RNA 2',3'-cyclic phosphodiesterase [Nitrospira sp.]|nr:RNA 2',3'-cyclic phosphodiesterase [Nitrospira sp.]